MTFLPSTEDKLRQGFKILNRLMVLYWRLGLGRLINVWPEGIGQIMVITHTGRNSGIKHRTPVNYAIMDGEIYCTAGFGSISDWYRNMRTNPDVEVWLPDSWWAGTAEEVTDPDVRLAVMRKVLINSGFAAYAAGIDPHNLPDEALTKVTATYHVMRIHRLSPRTGKGGPSDLAWVWPLATFILLPLAFMRRKPRGKRGCC